MPTPEEVHVFRVGLAVELFATVERELKNCPDELEAVSQAFEEVFHRIDFERCQIVASIDGEFKLDRKYLNQITIAIMFGNYLAHKGIHIDQRIIAET